MIDKAYIARSRGNDFRVFCFAFAAIAPLLTVWALVNPMFASPDEPSHIVRAQGVVQGRYSNPYPTDGLPAGQACYAFNSDQTADCMNLAWGADGLLQDSTTNNYPPLFHFVAGLPTLLFNGLSGAYMMRLWLALINALLLSWCLTLITRKWRSRWTVGGFLVAMTPTAIFVSSTVNPSGLSASFACCMFISGLVLASEKKSCSGAPVVLTFLASSFGMLFLRRDSIIWSIVVLVTLSAILGLRALLRLLQQRNFIIFLLTNLSVMMFTWSRWGGSASESFVSNSVQLNKSGSHWNGLKNIPNYLNQIFGWFGWLDSPLTDQAYWVILCLSSITVIVALVATSKAFFRGILLSTFFLFFVPTAIGYVRYPYLQGRYLLPVWVQLCVTAGIGIHSCDLPRLFKNKLFMVVAFSALLVQIIAFVQNLRRYAVGRTGTWFFYRSSDWHPPYMTNLQACILFACVISVSVTSCWAIIHLIEKDEKSIPV